MDPPGTGVSHEQDQAEPNVAAEDPPGDKQASSDADDEAPQENEKPPRPSGPQPFEIALARKLESKTTSVRGAFLLLDADGDGRISPADVRAVLHNELGLDITEEQEGMMFDRGQQTKEGGEDNEEDSSGTTEKGMGYAAFAKYYQEVSSATYPTSQSGLAAAVGFHRDDEDETAAEKRESIDRERSIHLQPSQVLHQKRHQLRQLLTSHSSRESPGKGGMKETSLFLAMDVHRSGKVTMPEMLAWANELGMLGWSLEEFKEVVLMGAEGEAEREELERKWFGDAEEDVDREAGMTEHEFAEFVESLDSE
ncbi:hypothetical protein ACHAXT_009568 [Thalassiosira profunda]